MCVILGSNLLNPKNDFCIYKHSSVRNRNSSQGIQCGCEARPPAPPWPRPSTRSATWWSSAASMSHAATRHRPRRCRARDRSTLPRLPPARPRERRHRRGRRSSRRRAVTVYELTQHGRGSAGRRLPPGGRSHAGAPDPATAASNAAVHVRFRPQAAVDGTYEIRSSTKIDDLDAGRHGTLVAQTRPPMRPTSWSRRTPRRSTPRRQ